MSAQIGEISVMETLLGKKVLESLTNHEKFLISALQRDIARPNTTCFRTSVVRSAIENFKPSAWIAYTFYGSTSADTDKLNDILKEFYPDFSEAVEDTVKPEFSRSARGTDYGYFIYYPSSDTTQREILFFVGIEFH